MTQTEASRDIDADPHRSPVAAYVGTMSDRAIQRVVGGNAFLRGRLYARRQSVEDLRDHGNVVEAEIRVRNADEPYRPSAELTGDGVFKSRCNCPVWRGPGDHCKHVAAVLVALRDRERPTKADEADDAAHHGEANGQTKKKKKPPQKKSEPVHVPGTVSAGGKRRRSRRRRRNKGEGDAQPGQGVQGAPAAVVTEARAAFEAWMPSDAAQKPMQFEYRVTVRPASITVTPVRAGSRKAVAISEALGAFNLVSTEDRPLLRALSRHAVRGKASTSELRGEDAAEVLGMLRRRRVLLEPASMELRFTDEPLKPRIELDRTNDGLVRVRVVFQLESNGRRFSLSNGAWFEGTPGWHIDSTDGVARPVHELVTPAWLQRLYRSPAIVQSDRELPTLLSDCVPRVAASLGAELPELDSVADLVDAQPKILVKADGDILAARARLRVKYREQTFDVPAQGFPAPLVVLPAVEEGGRPRVVRRDVGAEMAAVQQLRNLGFEVDESGEALVVEGDAAVSFWTEGVGSLPKDWERFIPKDLTDVTVRDRAVTPQVRVSSGVDWLSLDMRFDVDGSSVSAAEVRAALEHGRTLVRLDDGTYAPVEAAEVEGILAHMAEILATSGGGDRLPLSQAGRVNDLVRVVGDAEVSPSAKQLFDQLGEIAEVPQIPKPRGVRATLRPYQKQGFSWLVLLHELGSGGILADDMGLGKTLQTISLLQWAKTKHGAKLNLVVAPTSVVPNWAREIAKFAPGLETVIWHGPNRHDRQDALDGADVVLTSYALVRRDEELLAKLDLRYVILDEAQHIKNPVSHTARAVKRLQSERRLALTGTPIENRLSELWSIFDFVSPGLLGSLKAFEEKVARPIERGDEATAARLRGTVHPFVLRRLKTDVAADLPEKIEQEMIVELTDPQRALYGQVLTEVRKSVLSEVEKQGVSKAQIQILAALTRLRQVACDPRLMKLSEPTFDDGDSGKLAALREVLSEAVAGGHRVLVFSQFVEMLGHIRRALDEDGIAYEYLDGSTKDRLERVDRFNQNDQIPVFLISLKAGGTGLNLTGADTVIHFDPWWNPAVEDQATDRAHRIGQERVVTVYRLIAEGTVEEKILALSAKKRALVENVLSTDGSPLKGLTRADVDALFS